MKNIVIEMVKKVFDPKCRIEKTQINDNEYVIREYNPDYTYDEKYYKNRVLYKIKEIRIKQIKTYEVDEKGVLNGCFTIEYHSYGYYEMKFYTFKNGKLDGEAKDFINNNLVNLRKNKMGRLHGLYQSKKFEIQNHVRYHFYLGHFYQGNNKGFSLIENKF